MNQSNVRSRTTGNLELRKLWHVPEGKFFYALAVEYEQQECAMEGTGKHAVPNWNKITKTETGFNVPQGYTGDEEWAKRTAEHFNLTVPEEEYKEKKD